MGGGGAERPLGCSLANLIQNMLLSALTSRDDNENKLKTRWLTLYIFQARDFSSKKPSPIRALYDRYPHFPWYLYIIVTFPKNTHLRLHEL